jgi:hypothetical protein
VARKFLVGCLLAALTLVGGCSGILPGSTTQQPATAGAQPTTEATASDGATCEQIYRKTAGQQCNGFEQEIFNLFIAAINRTGRPASELTCEMVFNLPDGQQCSIVQSRGFKAARDYLLQPR